MKNENMPFDIKEIFRRKRVYYDGLDIARMRYLCKTFAEFMGNKGK